MMFSYEIRKSDRARSIRITVRPDERVLVTIPKRLSVAQGEVFVIEKKEWVEAALLKLRRRRIPELQIPKATASDYKAKKEEALFLVRERLAHFNTFYGYVWNTVAIKNTSTRWGSCSKKGNLNFNYRIIYLPEHIANYLIVHELCHLKEFNHSETFWKLVEKTIPEYQKLRKEIRVM